MSAALKATDRGGVAILGTGLAGLGHAGGRTEQEIIAQAAYRAVAASGLRMACLLYTSPSPRDQRGSRMPSSA